MAKTVSRFNVTPVKATALHHPEQIRLEPYGPVDNRDFYFVDEHGLLFAGAKLGPLVQIQADHDPEGKVLSMRFPDGTVVEGSAVADGEQLETNFFGRPVPAREVEGPWSEALSHYAGRDIRLLRVERTGDGNDIEPVTLVSIGSVEELARQGEAGGPLNPGRFRMTMEIDGCTPHEEDGWAGHEVRVGEAIIRVGEQVPRCVVTTQDPDTGLRDFPTLKVIKRYRGTTPDQELPFGVYAQVVQPGLVRLGDPVEPGN
jgi:uncharacterized protein YcbX